MESYGLLQLGSDDTFCVSNTNEAVNTAHGVSAVSTQDLQQLHPDDLEEIDLRWQMTMLTIRARRFLKNIGKKNSKKPRKQEQVKHKENTRSVPAETTTSNAWISCDGLGDYDWSDQAEEGPTNFALMA
ncbi:hypothetical protein Tco_0197283, partial [Tanacetum coccineum]